MSDVQGEEISNECDNNSEVPVHHDESNRRQQEKKTAVRKRKESSIPPQSKATVFSDWKRRILDRSTQSGGTLSKLLDLVFTDPMGVVYSFLAAKEQGLTRLVARTFLVSYNAAVCAQVHVALAASPDLAKTLAELDDVYWFPFHPNKTASMVSAKTILVNIPLFQGTYGEKEGGRHDGARKKEGNGTEAESLGAITNKGIPFMPDRLAWYGGQFLCGCHAHSVFCTQGEHLKTIGDNVFSSCIRLLHLDLSTFSNTTTIGRCFLWNNTVLTEVDISPFAKGLTAVGGSFMSGCASLKALDLSQCGELQRVGKDFLRGDTALVKLDLSGLVKLNLLGPFFLTRCSKLRTVVFPPDVVLDVRKLPSGFLAECSSLERLDNLQCFSNVTEVGDFCFDSCSSLTKLDLSFMRNVTKIGDAFGCQCRKLRSIGEEKKTGSKEPLLSNIESIGSDFFAQAYSLELTRELIAALLSHARRPPLGFLAGSPSMPRTFACHDGESAMGEKPAESIKVQMHQIIGNGGMFATATLAFLAALLFLASGTLALRLLDDEDVAAAAKNGTKKLHYNIDAAMEWINDEGCHNKTINDCPGNRLCTDAEYYARALAAGGLVKLDPNSTTNEGYTNYTGKYNLCLSPGLISFLEAAGFTVAPNRTYPQGSIAFTQMYPPGAPFYATGEGRCQSHTPIVAGGPHCDMACDYFVPRIVYQWPKQKHGE